MTNKDIQKKRMITYFVDAAVQIINEEGPDGVTIRKVAKKAGYNSATIYNYFDNLDHLLLFASMTYLDKYIDDLKTYIPVCKNHMDSYTNARFCFMKHSFSHPEIYANIFFANLNHSQEYYIAQYYKIFPLAGQDLPKDVEEMLAATNIKNRSLVILEEIVAEGKLEKTRARKMDDCIIAVYEAFLYRIIRGRVKPADAEKEVGDLILTLIRDVGAYKEPINLKDGE